MKKVEKAVVNPNNKTSTYSHKGKKNFSFFHPVIQPKLTINQPGDVYEKEADAMAENVMRMPSNDNIFFKPVINSIQRKCAACKEEEKLQKKAENNISGGVASTAVHEVINSSGQSLDANIRNFFESRFGYDFSNVQIHNNSLAHQSSSDINAKAYTNGNHIAFGAGQYQPNTNPGKQLLAHELTHVIQQGNSSSASKPIIFRAVGSVDCTPNVFGATDDPKGSLEIVQPIAVDLANKTAEALQQDSVAVKDGIDTVVSPTFQAYQDNFGLPVAAGEGFLNRLTGETRASQEIAASGELNILSKRFRLSARFFSQRVNYRCPPDTATSISLPGCAPGTCGGSFAFSCRGSGNIALCAPYWQRLSTDEAQATALIHESMHIIFGRASPSIQGEIGETTQKGSGRNFNVAGCYEFLVNALTGAETFPVCPDVP